jgi:hypothetical protein
MAKGKLKKKIKEALSKGEHLTAKVAMAPSRAAFLLANKVNFIRLAERLTHTYEKDPERVKKFWYEFGGEFKNLLPEMEKGVRLRKKHEAKRAAKRGEHPTNDNPAGHETTPTETADHEQLSGTLGVTGYDDAAYVAAASPIIIAALKMFGKTGDKKGANLQDSEALAALKEHLLSGNTPGVEVHATDAQGNSRVVATGGISTPIILAGVGALAVGGYFLLKKKTK